MITLLVVVDIEFTFFVENLRFFVSLVLIRAKETNEWQRLSFSSMLCLISAFVIAVASLFVGRNPRWVAVFGNPVDNSKVREGSACLTVEKSE